MNITFHDCLQTNTLCSSPVSDASRVSEMDINFLTYSDHAWVAHVLLLHQEAGGLDLYWNKEMMGCICDFYRQTTR